MKTYVSSQQITREIRRCPIDATWVETGEVRLVEEGDYFVSEGFDEGKVILAKKGVSWASRTDRIIVRPTKN